MFVEFVSLGDPSRRMFDDGAGMHEYLLCTILGLWQCLLVILALAQEGASVGWCYPQR
jgi:hypothetical protein